MKQKDKKHLLHIYKESLEKYGDAAEAVHWRSKSQVHRFKILAAVGDLVSASVFDIGCGKGDLYDYLVTHGFRGQYTGLELNPALVKLARQKHPQAIFKVHDVTKAKLTKKYDYALISGMFNNKISDNDQFIKKTLKKVFRLINKGLAFNLISSYVNFRDPKMHYAQPEKILAFCKQNLSRYVSLRHDYMPFDFTVYVYKKSDWGL